MEGDSIDVPADSMDESPGMRGIEVQARMLPLGIGYPDCFLDGYFSTDRC